MINKKLILTNESESRENFEQEYDVLKAWKLFEKKYGKEFPNITKLGTNILAFQISTSSVEREFKRLKVIKTVNRTSLKKDTLNSILIAKDMINEELISNKNFVNNIYSRYSELNSQENKNRGANLQMKIIS